MSNTTVSKSSSENDTSEINETEPNNQSHKSGTSKSGSGSLDIPEDDESVSIPNPLADKIQFDHSFGYDCQQHFNLCVIDEDVLVFYSGTLINIFYTKSKTFYFRKSYSRNGIGHIIKHPVENHLAIGEKGTNPLIIIYSWPSFDIVSKMAGGTTYGYSHLGYSPDGAMLVSQGKAPDHMITVWDWQNAHIILRVKGHGLDVYNAEFSQFVPGQITTSGLGHIKFWKMAKTFTGLKLQGELGRFGKTEICDILGICAMPDEKVISGSEWGNILVWEDRLIKLEVRQKAKGNCHSAAISQIHFNNSTQDIISVGMDGWIKLWTRATIDTANPPDEEDWYLEMQPLFELYVKDELSEAKLMSLCKKNSDPQDNDWYGQDGNGGIWSLNLSAEASHPQRLLTCHAGAVAAMAASPMGHYLATLGVNGCLLVHDVLRKELIVTKHFQAPGTTLLWLPDYVDASGAVLVGGFLDGVLRMFVASLQDLEKSKRLPITSKTEFINIIQRVKVHTAAITALCLNPRGSILVSGSQDKTIFIHQILPKREYITLLPVGFVELAAEINCITWRPKKNSTAIVACCNSTFVEVVLPERATSLESGTYSLNLDTNVMRFKSVKSELIRAQEIREIEEKKQIKLSRKQVELEKIKADNPNLDIDEELFLMDSDEELEFPPLYYPEIPSPVLFVKVLPNENLLISLGGYDCGFLYEYTFGHQGPVRSDPLPNALDTPANCFLTICDEQFFVMGMENGVIRLVQCEDGVPDLTMYYDLPMHDPEHGAVTHICTSCDGQYLYSCGTDGNIFTYTLEVSDSVSSLAVPKRRSTGTRKSFIYGSIPKEVVEDVNGKEEPSLEETKMYAERLNQQKLSNKHKEDIRWTLAILSHKFEYLIKRNTMLPESQVLPHTVFELDPRITLALQEKIDSEMELMKRKIAFKVARSRLLIKKLQNYFVDNIASLDVTVRAIKNEALRVKAFTHNKLSEEFLRHENELNKMLHVAISKSQVTINMSSRGLGSTITINRHSGIESMIKSQSFYHKLTLKAKKTLLKQSATKNKRNRRAQEWQMFLETKPNINDDDPDDITALGHATNTIGDFKLKSADTYRVPEGKRITPAQKYWQLLVLYREIYEAKEAFNQKVCEVRDSKISLVRKFKQLYQDLDVIQQELPLDLCKQRLPIPTCYLKNNFPEHIFRLEFGRDPQTYDPVSAPYDEEYFLLQVKDKQALFLDVASLSAMQLIPTLDWQYLRSLGADDKEDTPWEKELKAMRRIRLLHEQDMILKNMQDGVKTFDDNLETLSIERLKYARNIKLMEIFMLTLYQELIVIDSYAGREEEITERINQGIQIRNLKLQQKVTIQEAIEMKQQDIILWQLKLTDVQEGMAEKLLNNKFATFLNRIFKRKRVVKHTDDSESESSSSDDDTDETLEDEDNDDYIPIKLDENVCPEGCDPQVYQETIQSRNLRYDIEDSIADEGRQVDEHQRELQICSKDLAKLEVDVHVTTQELETLQFEKQQKLNSIETVVVLNLSQFRHFVTASHPEDGLVQNPLVFHSDVLFTLAGRVAELEKETEAELIKLKQEKLLMQRLDKRRKEMKEIKKSLIKEIDEEIVTKFGELIDVDLMEETMLKKMINQARRDFLVEKLREKYEKTIADCKAQQWWRTEDLMNVEKENTRRLKLQTMLEQEAMKLDDMLRIQAKNKEKFISPTEFEAFDGDIKQLDNILKEQLELNDMLNTEIRRLRYKCTPPADKKIERDIFGRGDETKITDTELKEHLVGEEVNKEGKLPENENVEGQISEEDIATIDKILFKLASGMSAYNVATSIVEELLNFTGDDGKKSSAFECAMKLIEELIQITSQENSGDIVLVERYAGELRTIAQQNEDVLSVVDLEED